MFLSRRATQEEYFDSERPTWEVAEFFRSLNRVNRFFDFAEPFRNLVPKLVHQGNCRSLSILDLGAGDGFLGRTVKDWAAKRGWNWQIVNLDSSLAALSLNPGGHNIAGSAIRLPFVDSSFDVVIASQMAHHLGDGEVKLMLQESWRVARQALLLCDLHRNVALYLLLAFLLRLQSHPASFRADALLSVKRAWRVGDLARLAAEAGVSAASVKLYFGARVILTARKERL
ncbi:MAG TPA: methyltransferase domain-containing protein [Patescibacteria group bacterium]|nr:methyltransferase domain-containing protein [Patescibacteria group bacterium]